MEETQYRIILLPTRPQPDTIVAIFLLRELGGDAFPGVKDAEISVQQVLAHGETEAALLERGIIPLDIGGGRFDHHNRSPKRTASDLVAEHLGLLDDPAIERLLEYARRDDFFGNGTISEDPLDRAFGLSALIANLNRDLPQDPARVVHAILPLLEAHYHEEARRTKDMPEAFAAQIKSGEAEQFDVKQRGKKLRVVMVTSDSPSMAGYLRAGSGGKFDVVAQWLPSGHVNILTRPAKRVDLRALAMLLRLEEANREQREFDMSPRALAAPGRISEVPQWYYDPATNSIQNGGVNPKEIPPTKIPRAAFQKIIELGLSEALWSPVGA